MRKLTVAFIAIWIGFVSYARGQTAPLADRVPGDALLYVGWAGSDGLAGKYDQSHLKAIIDSSEIPKFFDESVPQLIERVGQQNSQAADVMRQVVQIGKPLWRHPCAIYFGGIDLTGPQPQPKLALLCDAGDDAAALQQQIDQLLTEAQKDNPGPFPTVKTYGSLVVLAFGSPAAIDAQFQNPPVDSIAKAASFTAAIAQVQQDPAYVEYVDCPGIVSLVDQVLHLQHDPDALGRWTRVRDSLGLSGLHQAIVTAGFEVHDWGTQAFIGTSDSNQGILSLLHGTPLSPDLLKAVPQTADRVAAGKLDLDSLVGHLRDLIAQIDPSTGDQIDDALAKINQAAGLDIRKDFLAVLGDEWACYTDRTIAGPGFLGTVVVNRLRDAGAAEKALDQLAQRLNGIMAAASAGGPPVKVEFHDQVIHDITVHYLAIPLVTPSWAISDGNLYLGLYPQVVSAAADQAKRNGPSILDRPEYQAVMKQLGDHPANALSFCNLPATAPDSYSDVLMISRLYLGFADIFGVHPPAMMVPPLSKITPELSPSGAVSWTDSMGLHARSITPFPGADIVAGANLGSSIMMGEGAMAASILMPALSKARGQAGRVKSMSNERQLGLALMMYANDNQGNFPDDLGTLFKAEQLGGSVFVCPTGSTALPANFDAMTPDDKAKWINDNSDYVYLGKGLKMANQNARRIMIYEKDGAHEARGINLLFGDGHVEFQRTDDAQRRIQAQEGGM